MSKKLKQLVQKTKHTLVYKFEPLIDIYQKYNFYFFRFNKYRKNTPFPKHINIETTNICTNRCPFCYYGNIEKMPKLRLMTKEMFYRIIDELAEINFDGRISLFEINEPLTDPRIVDFVAHVKKKLPNAHQMMVTNGDLLSVEKLEKLFENGIDKLDLNSYNKKNLSRNLKLLKSVKYNPKKLCHYDKTQRFASGHWISRGGNIDKYVRRKVPKDACEFVYAQMVIKSMVMLLLVLQICGENN